jgi:hypothetical protein
VKVLIAHAAWDPSRREHVARMLERIPGAEVVASYEREHARVWARRLWTRAAERGGPVVCLNDDVDVCDDFLSVCESLVRAAPDRTIALHTTAPVAPSLAMCGERWLESYWVTGPGYIVHDYRALLAWLDEQPEWLFQSRNEDNVIMHYQWTIGMPVLHCIPAIVQHRTEIASTLGYDEHPLRSTGLFDAHPAPWPAPVSPLYVACPWMPERALAQVEAALAAHTEPTPEPKVAICTPSKGGNFTEEYVSSLWKTALAIRNGELSWIKMRYANDNVDIIRGRNRFLRYFLQETDCTELMWIDDDMLWDPEALVGVVSACRAGKDVIGVPYPMKAVHWDRVKMAVDAGRHPETFTSDYPVWLLGDGAEQDGNCVSVQSIGMGMMCMSRRAVAAMYSAALHAKNSYIDHPEIKETANLFGFVVDERRALLSDSHTICWHWRQLKERGVPWCDGKIWMYCGAGAPVSHVGKHIYRGYAEGVVGEPV